MRSLCTLAIAISATLAACGKTPLPGNQMGGPDAPASGGDASNLGTPAFEVLSADIPLAPGEQKTVCYYFHTSNTTQALVNKWVADMTPGSHHAILFLVPGGNGSTPDGTVDTSCSLGGQGTVWTFSSQVPHVEENLPVDDGAGKPLAQVIAPNTAAFFQLHYLNASDSAITAHIHLSAYALAAGTAFTQTDAYVTYQYNISVPPNATNVKVSATCPLPQGVKFWSMSTHSHKQSIMNTVLDGTTPVVSSTDWEHPTVQQWMATPFYTFTAPSLTWECTYNNTTPPPEGNNNITVVQGQSAITNEMCMASGYFFPATGPKFEVSANGQCLSL